MLETEAIVVSTDASAALVEVQRRSSCGHCDPEKGCATQTLTRFFGRSHTIFRALNPIGAEVGESVVVGVEEGAVFKGSLAVYALPLVFVLGGALLGGHYAATPSAADGYAALGALSGLVLGWAWVRSYSWFVGSNRAFQPVILHKASERVVQFAKE